MRAIIVLYIFLAIIALVVVLLHFSVKVYVSLDGDGFDLKMKYLFFTIYPRPEKKKNTNKKKKLKKNKTKDKHRKSSDTMPHEKGSEGAEKHLEKADEEKLNKPEIFETEEIKQPNKPRTKAQIKAERKREKAEKKRIKAKEKASKPSLKEKIQGLKQKWLKVKPYVPSGWKAVKKLLKTIRFMNTEIELSVGKEDAYDAAMTYGKLNAAVYDALAAIGLVFTMHYKKCKVNCVFNEKCFRYDVKTCVCVRPSTVISIAFCTLVNFLFVFLKEKRKAKKAAKLSKKANEINNINETEMCENE